MSVLIFDGFSIIFMCVIDAVSILPEEPDCMVQDKILVGKPCKEDGDSNVEQTILRSFKENPDFIGMIDAKTDEKVTFAQMKDRSIRCALWLRKNNLGGNDVVGISTPCQLNDYVPYLATLYVNAVINPWHYTCTEETARQCFATCPPRVMFACEQSIDKLSAIAEEEGIDCKFVAFKRHPKHISLEEILAEPTSQEVDDFKCTIPSDPKKKLSIIIYSSGTTSTAKAVMLSYNTLVTNQLKESGSPSGMRCVWFVSYAWMAYSSLLPRSILQRQTRIIPEKFEPESSALTVEKYKINRMFVRPYILILWHQAQVWARYDFTHVRVITIGGTKVNETLMQNYRMHLPWTFICNIYGSTEAGGSIAGTTPRCKHIDSLGFVSRGVQLKVVDRSNGALLGPNQQGEIYVKTSTQMLGYYKDDEETRKAIDEDGWLKTGDLGYYDEDGEVMLCDRLKAVIKMRDYILMPSEAEDVLMQHPAVQDCAVVAVDHPVDVERPFFFIVKAQGAQVTAEELIDSVASEHELYRINSGLVFVDEIPRTPSGKKWLIKLLEMAKAYLH